MEFRKELVFSNAEFERRLANVRRSMAEENLGGMLVHTPENIYYLTGYQTAGYYCYQTLLVPASGDPVLLVRLLEESNAKALSWVNDYVTYRDEEDPVETTRDLLAEASLTNGKRVGVEKKSWFFSIAQFEKLKSLLPNTTFWDCSGLVERHRIVKSDEELRYIRMAAKVADEGMRAGIAAIAAGKTENDVAAEVHRGLILAGGEYMSLPPFVASGYRSSLTHATWEGREIEKGDVVLIELSGCVKRYSAALFRTATVGQPSDKIKEMQRVALATLSATIEAIKPGVTAESVHEAARKVLAENGVQLKKRIGYSMGINFPPDWGEGHALSLVAGEQTVLQPGMVFHPPCVSREFGLANVAISETILVTEDGRETLSSLPREFFVK